MKESTIWDYIYSKKLNKEDIDNQGEWLEKYNEYVLPLKPSTVLDLGCGEGGNALYYKKLGYHAVACDFSKVVLDRIKNQNPDMDVNNFDIATGIPYEDNSIGVVVASLSLHYFSLEQTKEIINDIQRCLKSGGFFIFRVNSYKEYERNIDNMIKRIEDDFYKTRNGKKKRYFSVESMEDLLRDSFKVVQNFETELLFNGVKKYAIEGIARKE